MLTENLMHLTVAGGSEWVLVFLLVLSVVSVSVMVERTLFYRRRSSRLERLDGVLSPLLREGDLDGIRKVVTVEPEEPVLQAAAAGGAGKRRDRGAVEKVVASEVSRERLRLEKRLTFLGTLGNNAPFIGLFGTVLGIIRAFRDLSMDTQGNSSVVMAGISEALVATAVGLFVALPAVLAYNYFQKRVDRILSVSEALALGILAWLPADSGAGQSASAGGDGDAKDARGSKGGKKAAAAAAEG